MAASVDSCDTSVAKNVTKNNASLSAVSEGMEEKSPTDVVSSNCDSPCEPAEEENSEIKSKDLDENKTTVVSNTNISKNDESVAEYTPEVDAICLADDKSVSFPDESGSPAPSSSSLEAINTNDSAAASSCTSCPDQSLESSASQIPDQVITGSLDGKESLPDKLSSSVGGKQSSEEKQSSVEIDEDSVFEDEASSTNQHDILSRENEAEQENDGQSPAKPEKQVENKKEDTKPVVTHKPPVPDKAPTPEKRAASKSFSDEEVFKKLVTKSLSLDSQSANGTVLDETSGEPLDMDFHSLIRRNLTKRSVSLSEEKHSEKPVLKTLTFGPTKEEMAKKSEALNPPSELPCLLCDYKVDNKEDILAHLVLTHKFVIADVNYIANLPNYLKYWKKRLEEKPVSEFCSKIVTNTGSKDEAPKEEFYLLCDALPEDKSVRESLQKKKLEAVLAAQQREREETKFCRQCLFCKQTFCGNRSVLFDHLLRDHTFHMGQPDNLVFTDELFDLIQFKLDSQLCLFCEKSFKDKASLREHMRKKQHRKINPKNKEYDRFYIINYMEMGKNWESLQAEDNRLVKTSERASDEEEEWSGWVEDSEPKVVCLFCSFSCPNQTALHSHMLEKHDFDLQEVNQKLQLNFYQKVKLINYIRRQVYHKTCYGCMQSFEDSNDLTKHFGEFSDHLKKVPEASIWDQPQYFFPTYEDDSLLCHLDDDDDGAAGDAQGVTVIAEDIPVKDTILSDHKIRRELQKV